MPNEAERVDSLKSLKTFSNNKRVDVLGLCQQENILRDMLNWAGARHIQFFTDYSRQSCGEVCLYQNDVPKEYLKYYQASSELNIQQWLYDYYERWRSCENETVRLLKGLSKEITEPEPDAKHVAVLVQPTLGDTIPMYMLVWVFLLASSSKLNVTILMNDYHYSHALDFDEMNMQSVLNMTRFASEFIPVVYYSNYKKNNELTGKTVTSIERVAKYSIIHLLAGETVPDEHGLKELLIDQLKNEAKRVYEILDLHSFDEVLVFNGTWCSSGVLYEICEERKIQCLTVEINGAFCLNGPAVHHRDIPYVVDALQHEDNKKIFDEMMELILAKKTGQVKFNMDLRNEEGKWKNEYENYILLLPNIVWETSVLGLHDVFEGTMKWIEETAVWLVENTEKTLIVRRHPAEREFPTRVKDDMEAILKPYIEMGRVVFISQYQDVNTYCLIENADCVLIASGTAGLEATALGKPVISCCDAYYTRCGAIYRARTKDEYYGYLSKVCENNLGITEQQRKTALLYYYVLVSCNIPYCYSIFDGWPQNLTTNMLREKMGADLVIESIVRKIPVALLQHRQNIGVI